MSVAIYMKVEGATGESQDAAHQGWTDVVSFQWGVTQPGSMATGGGGGTGKASFKDLTVVARIDKAMPAVMKHCATGKHLAEIQISVNKAGGSQIEYERITLSNVLATDVHITGAADDDQVTVHYSFQAARVKNQYWEQTAQGGKGAESQMGYDVKGNKEM